MKRATLRWSTPTLRTNKTCVVITFVFSQFEADFAFSSVVKM